MKGKKLCAAIMLSILFCFCAAVIFAQDANFAQAARITLGSGNVTINRAGDYVLSGTLRNGQVLIDPGKNGVVRLQLNGAYIENPNGPAIYMKSGAELIINLAAGTENTLIDGKNYRAVSAAGEDDPKAALYVKNSLTIGGSGKLSVTGNYRNGIHAKDALVISRESGNISVNAVEEAIQGGDSVTILGGVFDLRAGNDGLKSNNSDAGKGNVTINGGMFTITAGRDAVQADNGLTINGGIFTIKTGGGAAAGAAISGRNSFGNGDWGARGWNRSAQFPAPAAAASGDSESYKAFKAGKELVVSAGTFTIDAQDDAFHSNGNLTVRRGTFSINTGDDAFHADNALRVEGGTINILACYEGLEGKTIDIAGGGITIVSSDDAINAADGRATSGVNNSIYARISGGTIKITATGDGVDANGNLYLAGGELYVSGPSMGMQGAIDLDGSFVVSGGKLITAGSSLSPSSQSTQPVILISYTAARNSGSVISLRDSSGRALLEYTARTQFSASAFSSPDIKTGQTYGLYIDGKKITDVTVRGTVTAMADNGGTYAVGRGGPGGGPGGGRGRR
ncbi:MAG: carbohydrate-binding domain-containing protein [Treponema sp.]|nr:carbohydrate-binding domain-containing protein [Treponema sp.]